MNSLELTLYQFLKKHLNGPEPLLVAFSGGVDSFALVYLLQKCQRKISFEFELAHLDHNYRKTSSIEAAQLQTWAESQKIKFCLGKIDELKPKHSLENFFRQKRYQFFLKLWEEKKYQALLLAHHLSDLEETTLKRVLEGAALENLNSLKPISFYQQIPIWRPLLEHPKEQILKWAEKQHIPYIIDGTNFDQSNLRSRFRLNTIPQIEQDLGKNIRSSLSALAKQSELLLHFLEFHLKSAPQAIESFFGYYWTLNNCSYHLYEWNFWIKRELKKLNILLSRQDYLTLAQWLNESLDGKKMHLKQGLIYFKDHHLILISKPLPTLPLEPLNLSIGTFEWGIWHVDVKNGDTEEKLKFGWFNLLSKNPTLFIQIPIDTNDTENIKNLNLSSRLTKLATLSPNSLNALLPQVKQNQKLKADFAKFEIKNKPGKSFLNISLTYKRD